MGYNTIFKGRFNIDKPLKPEHRKVIEHLIEKEHGNFMPSKFCQWEIDSTGKHISWDGKEKFYAYESWIGLIVAILEPMGYKVNGKVFWIGEKRGDVGTIKIKDNAIKIWSSKRNAEFINLVAEVLESNFDF